MTHGFNVMAVRIQHEGPVVVRVIMGTHTRCPIVSAPCRECGGVEGIYCLSILRRKSNVRDSRDWITYTNPEKRFGTRPISCKIIAFGIQPLNAQRS